MGAKALNIAMTKVGNESRAGPDEAIGIFEYLLDRIIRNKIDSRIELDQLTRLMPASRNLRFGSKLSS